MSDIYRQQILEHYKHPQHWGQLELPNKEAEVDNPTCGDRIEVDIAIKNNHIEDLAFQGEGCAICIASSSILGDLLIGQPISKAKTFPKEKLLSELGIDPGPTRLKCALLPLEAAAKALA